MTNAINRIVEDMNHRFTIEVLTRNFKSNDLGISAKNLRKDREKPTDIPDRIDIAKVNETLKSLLEIRDNEEQSVEIQDGCTSFGDKRISGYSGSYSRNRNPMDV